VLEALEERALLSFVPAVNYPVGSGPQSQAVASFRGNGILDLAIPNINSNTVSVLLGNGDGTFQSAADYPTGGSGAGGVAAGEFRTGSGIQDLVVSNIYSGTLAILRGNGDGTFQNPVLISGFPSVYDVKAADFNQDSNLDLMVTSQSTTVSILLGNGDGTFQAPVNYATPENTRQVRAADLRGIGVLDLVVTPVLNSEHEVMVLLGNGDGTFQPPVSYYAKDPSNVAVGEFRTGSGILDLAVTDRNDNSVSVLLGNGDGTFQPSVSYPIGDSSIYPAIAVGDFNQDGNLDLVATNFGGNTVSVLLGNGDGTFQAPTSYAVGTQPDQIAVGDFNGDGYPDLAVNNYGSNNVSILLNDQNWGGGGSPGRQSARAARLGQNDLAAALAEDHAPLSYAPANGLPAQPARANTPLLEGQTATAASVSDSQLGFAMWYDRDTLLAAHRMGSWPVAPDSFALELTLALG
jgi:hypothetical protein